MLFFFELTITKNYYWIPVEVIPVQQDLIAELKTCKDISVVGIKKLKVERAKEEVQQEQSQAKEFEKQFTYDNFLEKVSYSL